MTIKEYTAYQKLELPFYDVPGWHQYIDRNFHAIDGYMYLLTGVTNVRGVWQNNTVYHVSDLVVDHISNTIHKCLIQNTSSPTGTFQAYRVVNPTHWSGPVDVFQGSSTTTRFEFLNTDDAVSVSDASVEMRGGVGIAKRLYVGSYVTIASTDGYAFSVGRLNRVNPGFAVDTSNVLSNTGILVVSKPAGSSVAIDVISPNANENLTINAKGTGIVAIGNVSTGGVGIVSPLSINNTITINTTSATALAVGDGGTNTLVVDTTPADPSPGIRIYGVVGGGGAVVTVISPLANEPLILNAKGTEGIYIGSPNTVAIYAACPVLITKPSINAFYVGANGGETFRVDTTMAPGVSAGIRISGLTAGSGAQIDVISSVANDSLRINAKGTGSIAIGDVSTGFVGITPPLLASAAVAINTTHSSALAVGAGSNLTFRVDTSVVPNLGGIVAYGVVGANAGGAIAALGPTANEGLTISAKGTGTLRILTSGIMALDSTVNIVLNSTAGGPVYNYGKFIQVKEDVSSSSTTGAIVINGVGGLGVGGNIYTGGLITATGTVKSNSNLHALGVVIVGGSQVLNVRQVGWGTNIGAITRAAYDPATVTLPVLAQTVSALINDLKTHGMIGA